MGKPEDIPEEVAIAALQLVLKPLGTSLHHYMPVHKADAIKAMRGVLGAQIERDAAICEQQRQGFLSPEYASNQPLGSLMERFACDECAAAIRGEA